MQARLISQPCAQLAKLVGLVRSVEPAQLEDGKTWGLLLRGRGFNRLLEQELLDAPGLLRPTWWSMPRPIVFRSRQAAAHYAKRVGLLPAASRWTVAEDE